MVLRKLLPRFMSRGNLHVIPSETVRTRPYLRIYPMPRQSSAEHRDNKLLVEMLETVVAERLSTTARLSSS
jgi:hypothetical protein